MGRGSSKISEGSAKASTKTFKPRGDVSFEEIVKASDNSISFSKIVTLSPKNFMPETGRKRDLGELLARYNITDVTIDMYRDKSGANDLKRMKDLGFEIEAQYKGKSYGSVPPKDYYYMVKKKKKTKTS